MLLAPLCAKGGRDAARCSALQCCVPCACLFAVLCPHTCRNMLRCTPAAKKRGLSCSPPSMASWPPVRSVHVQGRLHAKPGVLGELLLLKLPLLALRSLGVLLLRALSGIVADVGF